MPSPLYHPVTFVRDGAGSKTALRTSDRGAVFARLPGGNKRYYNEKQLDSLKQRQLCRLAMRHAVKKYLGEFPVKQAVAVAHKQTRKHYPQCQKALRR